MEEISEGAEWVATAKCGKQEHLHDGSQWSGGMEGVWDMVIGPVGHTDSKQMWQANVPP